MSQEILHQPSWAKTLTGRDIELYECKNSSPSPILFVGGVHGDEPEGVRLAQDLLSWLQKNNKSNFHSWLLIPCLNVDGYADLKRTNANGVDLNRNFASPDWSQDCKAPRYYPGVHAASEIEVQKLSQLILDRRPHLIVHFHSWQPCVVYTGSSGKEPANILATGTGYEAREDIGYPTPGSLGQYGWLTHQIPVVCIEAQENSPLETIWPKFEFGLKKLISQGTL